MNYNNDKNALNNMAYEKFVQWIYNSGTWVKNSKSVRTAYISGYAMGWADSRKERKEIRNKRTIYNSVDAKNEGEFERKIKEFNKQLMNKAQQRQQKNI